MFSFEDGIELRKVKVVITRKEHFCPGLHRDDHHTIPPKTRAVRETALVDGKFAQAYTCEKHIEMWQHECEPN
jgi:hypothetical protein